MNIEENRSRPTEEPPRADRRGFMGLFAAAVAALVATTGLGRGRSTLASNETKPADPSGEAPARHFRKLGPGDHLAG